MTPLHSLSNREREVVELLLEGKSNKLIALALGISERTVEFHLTNIYNKFQVSSRIELILKLENTASHVETENLGDSTVDKLGENTKNSSRLNLQRDWITSFKTILSSIGKELKMKIQLDTDLSGEAENMTFYEAIRVCLIKYAEFSGRATRMEFWWFAVFVTLVAGALAYINVNVSAIFQIAMLLPVLAVGARRLHDIGKSSWWLLFALVPVGGIILLIILWAMPPMSELPKDTSLA